MLPKCFWNPRVQGIFPPQSPKCCGYRCAEGLREGSGSVGMPLGFFSPRIVCAPSSASSCFCITVDRSNQGFLDKLLCWLCSKKAGLSYHHTREKGKYQSVGVRQEDAWETPAAAGHFRHLCNVKQDWN